MMLRPPYSQKTTLAFATYTSSPLTFSVISQQLVTGNYAYTKPSFLLAEKRTMGDTMTPAEVEKRVDRILVCNYLIPVDISMQYCCICQHF